MSHSSNPYGDREDRTRFEVNAQLNLTGVIEFHRVRHHTDGRLPTSEITICGIPVTFATPEESDQFAAAAQIMASQHHIAWDRNQVRGIAGPA